MSKFIYVNANATSNGNGSSWENAYKDLTDAIATAVSGDQIWVAKGVYYPPSSQSFSLKNGVEIYGGFAGNETNVSQRNWQTNQTILNGSGNRVIRNDYVDSTAVLDGFTITGGDAGSSDGGGMYNYSSSPTIRNITFSGNRGYNGGGMYNQSSSPIVDNVTFLDNSGYGSGGGMYNASSSPKISNVIFSGNGSGSGGGIANLSSSLNISNATFLNNSVNGYGGGIYNRASSTTITNGVFFGNSAWTGGGISNYALTNAGSSSSLYNVTFYGNNVSQADQGSAISNYGGSSSFASASLYNSIIWGHTISNSPIPIYNNAWGSSYFSYSLIQGLTSGGTNINSDPLFMDAANGDFRLQVGSPALNTGSNSYLPSDSLDLDKDGNITEPIPFDLAGKARIQNTTVDMGAYEGGFTNIALAVSPSSVTEDGTTNLVYTFSRTGLATNALTVNYNISGTADSADYTGATPGTGKTITFAAGSNTATLTIDPKADTTIEEDETITLTLVAGTGYKISTDAAVTGIIVNDDGSPTLAIAATNATQTEGNSGTKAFTFTVTRSVITSGTNNVNWAVTATGTNAANGADFGGTLPYGTLTFAPGETSKVITVNVSGDVGNEPSETFAVTLSNPTNGAIISTATAIGTILNDEPVGTYNTSGITHGVQVVNNYAYVADFDKGLQIIDISNPASPTLKGICDTTDAWDVQVVGKYAYVADVSSGLRIIDITNPSNPILKGTYNTSHLTYGVQVVNNYAYVVGDNLGLQIIDISNPASPTLKGTYDISGFANDVQVVGNYAYLGNSYYSGPQAYSSRLQIIDISNPASPTLKGTYDTSGNIQRVQVVSKYAYVAYNSGLQIIDISNPASPTFKGTYDTTGWFNDVQVVSKYAYVVNMGSGSGLQIIDVSNPASPTLKDTYDTYYPGYVQVVGNYAYVAGSDAGLQIFDVSWFTNQSTAINLAVSPSNVTEDGTTNLVYTFTRTGPTTNALTVKYSVGGTATFDTDYTQSGAASFTATTGTITFAAGSSTATLTIDPTADTTLEDDESVALTLAEGTGYSVGTINAVAGTMINDDGSPILAIAATNAPTNENDTGDITAHIFTVTRSVNNGVTNSVNWTVAGTGTHAADGMDFGGTLPSGILTFAPGETSKVITVNVSGDTKYEPDESFSVTLSNPSNGAIISTPTATGTIFNNDYQRVFLVGSYNTPGYAYDVDVVNNYAYVADSDKGLQIIDISNPTAPTLKGTYDTPSLAYDVQVVNNYAYVADNYSGLQIIDISNPATPTLKGTYNTSGAAYDVQVVNNYAYVADYDAGLRIIDITNPSNPILKGTYNTPGYAYDVDIVNNYAYVADYNSGLQIIDITNPTSPTLKGTYNTSGSAYEVWVSGNYAYVADGSSGLQIIDITNPASPTLKGTCDTPGQAYGVQVVRNYAYVADYYSGLQIIDISNPATPTIQYNYDTPDRAYGLDVVGDYAYIADQGSGLQILDVSSLTTQFLTLSPTNAIRTEGNTGIKAFTFTVTRAGNDTNTNTVNWAVTGTGSNPANASDFGGILPSGTVTLNSGDSSQVITVNVSGDTTIEPNETFTVTLSNPTNGATLATATATGTIQNDDFVKINLSPSAQTVVEGLTSPQTISYTVKLSTSSTQSITVQYNTANGTALAGSDYTAKTGNLTFNPGVTTQTITIPILNNSINEANETFTLNLSNPTNAVLGTTKTATTTITDTLSAATTTTLPANVENLTLTGTTAIDGTGNAGHNVIQGNSANNILNGANGNDTLIGGAGNDTLTGGAGADDFKFNSFNDKLDRITDFSLLQGDEIVVSAAGFGGGLVAGADITQAQFFLGTAASDASDRFIYNAATGALYFDLDGTGAAFSQVQIATLSTGLALNYDDIFVVA